MIIWLASYPKSGNTWLRSLLASYYFSKDGSFDFKLLDNIDQFPSTQFFRDKKNTFSAPEDTSNLWLSEQEKINQDNKIRFLKTHNALCKINSNSFTNEKNTLAGIYIIRDPRNIVTSLANHYQLDANKAFGFMKDEKKALIEKVNERYLGFVPILSWVLHQESWIKCTKFPVLTIRYEDLQLETFQTLLKVIKFINKLSNLENLINETKAKKSIISCEFEKLKKLENKNGFSEAMVDKKTKKKISFFNLGRENDYKRLLQTNLIDEMSSLYNQQIKKFNYE
ncbi:sulfotransferase domain-containing protein [Candidatus Pelagibacter sp.]|nr:sulfotransferase domain-containing protein [Candidatus Pelagibacter bacterium]MDB3970401.1 sulfotransferase domain-containing protein [Candidatus Pelagibacter sp.]